jgi:hypothetical protein
VTFKHYLIRKEITKQNNFHRIYEQNCSVWKTACLFYKDNIQDQAFKTWFEPIKSVELTDNALYIQVPSKFFYEWLEEHYVKLLK